MWLMRESGVTSLASGRRRGVRKGFRSSERDDSVAANVPPVAPPSDSQPFCMTPACPAPCDPPPRQAALSEAAWLRNCPIAGLQGFSGWFISSWARMEQDENLWPNLVLSLSLPSSPRGGVASLPYSAKNIFTKLFICRNSLKCPCLHEVELNSNCPGENEKTSEWVLSFFSSSSHLHLSKVSRLHILVLLPDLLGNHNKSFLGLVITLVI